MEHLIEALFESTSVIRYVAIAQADQLTLRQRSDVANASESESDRYEELLVNPVLLLLTRQRGAIDCGGMEYVLVRYGNFFQLILPFGEGHVSIAIEAQADPLTLVDGIHAILIGWQQAAQ